jgi:hypothetical protein
MRTSNSTRLNFGTIVIIIAATAVSSARAQEAEVAVTIGRQIIKTLGKDAVEFGGETTARQTAKRLLVEAAETGGATGSRVARTQIERVLATGKEGLVFDLKALSGKSLSLLDNVTDETLPAAVSALARPGVGMGIESLETTALQQAALAGEVRMPGVGLKIVQHYGDDGAQLVGKLTEDQANSMVAALRPNAIKALSATERSKLLNALASRPDARVFNLEKTTGPLVVVASGVVIWHAIDVGLAPDELLTERPDGTVVREKISVGSRAAQAIPIVAREIEVPLKWTGVTLAIGVSMVTGILLWRRRTRIRQRKLKSA